MSSDTLKQIGKWAAVLAVGCLSLVVRQYAEKGAIDLQALAAHVANALDVLAAGGLFGWALLDRPDIMRPPSERQEDVP